MTLRSTGIVMLAAALGLLANCSQEPGEISRDSEPFDGIAADETIWLSGTEPFWAFEIAPDGEGYAATYSHPENIEGARFEVTRFAGNNGLGFSGDMEGEAVQIALTPDACSDGMSDRTYPFAATVAMGGDTLFGCAYSSNHHYSGESAP